MRLPSLALLMLTAVVACGGTGGSDADAASSSSTTVEATTTLAPAEPPSTTVEATTTLASAEPPTTTVQTTTTLASAEPPSTTVQATTTTQSDAVVATTTSEALVEVSSASSTTTVVPYAEPTVASMDTDLCRLADHRGLTRYVYTEPMVDGIDYTNRGIDRVHGLVFMDPQYSTGFPISLEMLPAIGALGVAFLAVDFPDSPATENQLAKIRTVAEEVNDYYRVASGGRFQMDFTFGDRVFRVPQDSTTFGLQGAGKSNRALTVEVLKVADPFVDLTGVRSVFMLIPENNTTIANDWHYPPHPGWMGTDGSPTGQSIMTDEGTVDAWSGNGYYFHRADIISRGGVAMFYVHESLHDMGIVDLYLYGYQEPDEIYAFGPTTLPMGDWAMMSQQNGNARELIAWHKWLLGWLSDEQVYCVPVESLTDVEISLSPATREADGFKAVMIPVNDRKIIVVESRRAEGYSATAGDIAIGVDVDGVRQRRWLNQFGSEGLIVYTYDTSVFNGSGAARLQIPEGRASDWKMATCPFVFCGGTDRASPWLAWDPENPENILLEALPDPLVRLGDKVIVEGITIELLATGESDRVRISK